ncbi:hypothetical protein [Clostridium beijerinckii]|uniref:Uncharacterized protein n=1 Tax=Clostridium beijerinckii TaxID=1520 RepID=A0AAE5LRZ2_CLOBE|nr:hypothetical protein [Clostridium beijerinckii]NOW85337.1 hypothetical protein [Clostridium beijerinckii]NSB16483.1 hypothetical protein [Clostridium beijerinckii]OOM25688.1 hypothetical protein CLOBE_34830 [Clostridium beijerinckii]
MIYEHWTGCLSFLDREKLKDLPKSKKEYELYKHNFIKNGGLGSEHRLLTYEEFKEVNEKEDNDDY